MPSRLLMGWMLEEKSLPRNELGLRGLQAESPSACGGTEGGWHAHAPHAALGKHLARQYGLSSIIVRMIRKGTRVLIHTSAADRELAPSSPAGSTGAVIVGTRHVEDLRPGDIVYTHDGRLKSVVRVTKRRYSGTIIAISYDQAREPLWLTEDHLVLTKRRVKQLNPDGMWSGIPGNHIDFARQMRRQPTPPEAHLWKRLRGNQLGVPFRRQHQIGPYIADFYCRQASLVVEVDGASVHSSAEAKDYDSQRDAYMSALGLRILRFPAADVSSRTDAVVAAILYAAQETVIPDDSEKQWRYAGSLILGDTVYCGVDQIPVPITGLRLEDTTEDAYALEVEGASSLLTDICAIRNGPLA
ncbi:MAG: intein C-terminal splicing region/intein N-terminal splicing region [Chthonomonadaceae bacterium]|nr:intein C-terminal splicing region/intein N-terminal splicing region [Chthonomonadaceae bacterium]